LYSVYGSPLGGRIEMWRGSSRGAKNKIAWLVESHSIAREVAKLGISALAAKNTTATTLPAGRVDVALHASKQNSGPLIAKRGSMRGGF